MLRQYTVKQPQDSIPSHRSENELLGVDHINVKVQQDDNSSHHSIEIEVKLGNSKEKVDQEEGKMEESLPKKLNIAQSTNSEFTKSENRWSKFVIILLLFLLVAALCLVLYVFYVDGSLDNLLEPILGPKTQPEIPVTPVEESDVLTLEELQALYD